MGPYPFQPFRCRRSPGLDLPPAVQQQPGLLPGITEATPGEAGLLGSWWDDCCVIWGYPHLWKPPYGNKHWESIGKTFWCLELGTDPNLGTPLNPKQWGELAPLQIPSSHLTHGKTMGYVGMLCGLCTSHLTQKRVSWLCDDMARSCGCEPCWLMIAGIS